jgi:repressor LexA
MLKFISDTQFILMKIPDLGQIGAGSVVPFTPRRKQPMIPVPIALIHAEPVLFEVCGDSFINENIYDGDTLIARKRFIGSEVTPGRLSVVCVDGDEYILKRVYILKDKIRLCSANPRCADLLYSFEMVEIIALIEGKLKYKPLR